MSYMATKNTHPQKVIKNVPLTIRLDSRKNAIIQGIQQALSDSVRGSLNKTEAIEAALEIAAEKLNVTPKHTA